MPHSNNVNTLNSDNLLTSFEKKYGWSTLVAKTKNRALQEGFSVETVESIQGPRVRMVGLVKIIFADLFMGEYKATVVRYKSSEIATALEVLNALLNLGWPLCYSLDNWQIFINETKVTLLPEFKKLNFQVSLVDNTKADLDANNEVCILYTSTINGDDSFYFRQGLLLYLQTPTLPNKHYLSIEEARWWAVAKGLEGELSENL